MQAVRTMAIALALVTVGVAGCTGAISTGPPQAGADDDDPPVAKGGQGGASSRGGSSGSGEPLPPGPVDVDPAVCAKAAPDPGPAPLRRLNNRELDATLRDLVGEDGAPASSFVRPNLIGGYDTGAEGLTVTALYAEQLHAAMARVADQAVAKLAPCASSPSAACAEAFVRTLGKRAFRRPVTDAEVARYRRVYDAGAAEAGVTEGLRWAVQALLESPSFLYRVERGEPAEIAPGVQRPTAHEMASRLSYLLWGTMPDAELLAAADAGRLRTDEEILGQAERLLGDARAAGVRAAFHELWLHTSALADVGKDANAFPAYTDEVRALQAKELATFLARTTDGPEASFSDIFTTPATYLDAKLARFYGVQGPGGTAFERVATDPKQRAGLLTQGGLLSMLAGPVDSSPVLRGVFVLERLLCAELPAPPAEVDATPPPPDPKRSTRERVETLTSPAACRACHGVINPVGYGFESYDAVGQFRVRERNGAEVDARGEIKEHGDASGPFDGAVALGQRLASSETARDCFVRQAFRFGVGRVETEGDACAVRKMNDTFTRAGGQLRALTLALVGSDAFRYRRKDQ